MDSDYLPFGRTQVRAQELQCYIDKQTATAVLSKAGVDSAADRLDSFISQLPDLLSWLETHGRDYPWRYTTDPWRIYATEILLQRTRGDAVASIYVEFFSTFPSPEAILEKSENRLRECVRSLGFVNHRVRTLTGAARLCVDEYNGEVPADLEALQRPWRTGPYTARACMLFAFNEPLALVDANTARITGRFFDYPLPAQPHKSDEIYQFLDALAPDQPALARSFNLALLDLGALRCTDGTPECDSCPVQTDCSYPRI